MCLPDFSTKVALMYHPFMIILLLRRLVCTRNDISSGTCNLSSGLRLLFELVPEPEEYSTVNTERVYLEFPPHIIIP